MNLWFRAAGNSQVVPTQRVNRLGRLLGALVVIAATIAAIGCDSDSFVPPRSDELRAAVGAATDPANGPAPSVTSATAGKAVEVVLSKHDPEETEYMKSAARAQAGLDRARIRIVFLGANEPVARQAALIREAVERHPLALVVEPADPGDAGLAKAVQEARDAGVPVVVLGHGLAGIQSPEAAKPGKAEPTPGSTSSAAGQASAGTRARSPLVVVTVPSFEPIAKQLVASAIRTVKNGGEDPKRGAVIVFDPTSDSFVDERLAAMRAALNAAGVTKIQEMRVEHDNARVEKVLTEFLRANSDFVMVFALDHLTFTATRQVAIKTKEERPFVSAGYSSDEHLAAMVQVGEFAALAEYVPLKLIRRAVNAAIGAGQGREVPPRVELPITLHDSPERTALSKATAKGAKKPG